MGRYHLAALATCFAVLGLEHGAWAEPWAAPSGLYGGGLGMDPVQSGRIWADVALFTRAESTRTLAPGFTVTQRGFTLLSPIFGVGILATPSVELEAVLPVGTTIADNGGTGIGNPYVGVSYVLDGPAVRIKVGGGLALPVVNSDSADQLDGAVAGLIPRGAQTGWLWAPDALGVVFPFHIEAPLGTPVVFIGDATPYILVPVRRRSGDEMLIELTPGFGAYVSDSFMIGARLPMLLQLSGDSDIGNDDRAQVSLEPFLRLVSKPVFFSVRFTMPLDEPLGFAFDTGKFWGIQLGLGGGF